MRVLRRPCRQQRERGFSVSRDLDGRRRNLHPVVHRSFFGLWDGFWPRGDGGHFSLDHAHSARGGRRAPAVLSFSASWLMPLFSAGGFCGNNSSRISFDSMIAWICGMLPVPPSSSICCMSPMLRPRRQAKATTASAFSQRSSSHAASKVSVRTSLSVHRGKSSEREGRLFNSVTAPATKGRSASVN